MYRRAAPVAAPPATAAESPLGRQAPATQAPTTAATTTATATATSSGLRPAERAGGLEGPGKRFTPQAYLVGAYLVLLVPA
jgi:hypothetical protein